MLADRLLAAQQSRQAVQTAGAAPARVAGNARAQELARLLDNENVKRTLQMIRTAEGTQQYADPARVNFGGSRNADLSRHPNIARPFNNMAAGPNATTATGAYQFLGKTWNNVARQLELPDFGRKSQDLAALELIRQRGGLDAAMQGNVPQLARLLGNEWASLGNNNYRQPTKNVGYLQAAFNAPLADGGTSLAYKQDRGGRQVATSNDVSARNTAQGASAGQTALVPPAQDLNTSAEAAPLQAAVLDPTQQFFVDQLKLLQASLDDTRLSEPSKLPEYGA